MTSQSGTQSISSSIRAQSTVLGVVLLIGMVAVGSASLFLVASAAISDTEQQAEQEQIEQSFVELSESMATVATDGDVTHTLEAETGESGAITETPTGEIEVYTTDGSDEQTVGEPVEMGAIEYTDGETAVAYQAGGVWKEENGDMEMLSAPPINYDRDTETLSFQIPDINDDTTINSGDISINKGESDIWHESVQEERVFVKVESEYCQGWEQYFSSETSGVSVSEPCDEGEVNEDGTETLRVGLGYAEIENAFEDGVGYHTEGEIIEGPGNPPFGDAESDNYESLTDTVRQIIGSVEQDVENGDAAELTGTNTAGSYYTDQIDDDVTFNLSEGDAVVAVDGYIDTTDNEIDVTNCNADNTVRIFMNGSLYDNGGISPSCDDGDEKTIQIFGTSDSGASFGSSDFEGLFYAASSHVEDNERDELDDDVWEIDDDMLDNEDIEECDSESNPVQVCFRGEDGDDFNGGIVASVIETPNSVPNINIPEVSEIEPLPEDHRPEPITYLNVGKHDVEINNE